MGCLKTEFIPKNLRGKIFRSPAPGVWLYSKTGKMPRIINRHFSWREFYFRMLRLVKKNKMGILFSLMFVFAKFLFSFFIIEPFPDRFESTSIGSTSWLFLFVCSFFGIADIFLFVLLASFFFLLECSFPRRRGSNGSPIVHLLVQELFGTFRKIKKKKFYSLLQ